MTNRDRILALLESSETALTDAEIRRRTGIEPHQQVNQICRSLAAAGLVDRRPGAEGRIVNRAAHPSRSVTIAEDLLDRAEPRGTGELPKVDFGNSLIVIPCSGRKRRGGEAAGDGTSIVDWLPDGLAEELLEARQANASSIRLDDQRIMPAVERYAGTLYESAVGAFERIEEEGAELAIMSGGYGVILGSEPIGWYSQYFDERMWPEHLVARCLGAYAAVIEATTVVGLLAGSTAYAKVFREVQWPETVEGAWLVSPELSGGGAQVKVPRAIGEALRDFANAGTLQAGWASSDGVPLRVVATDHGPEDGVGTQGRGLVHDAGRAEERLPVSEPSTAGRGASAGMTISLDDRDATRLEAARERFVASLAGRDETAGRELERLITPEGFATYLVRTSLDRLDNRD